MAPHRKIEIHPLEACFNLLSGMGLPGRWVWATGKKIINIKEREEYLWASIRWLYERKDEEDWKIPPVDFRTFVECSELLNSGCWPEVMRCGMELNSGKYTECVLTGGIGTGKSHLAVFTQAYQLYVLTCMANPHAAFDLDPSSEITIIFQSVSKELAKEVDYNRFRALVDASPYFTQFAPYDKERESDMRFLNTRIVVKAVSGLATSALGQNVIGGIIDEVNFMAVTENSKMSRDGNTYDQATENYNALARRRESRFMQLGHLPGMLCLVSSRNYPGQFTDKKEEEARTNPRIYIYDKRNWEVQPWKYSGEMFPVFVGDASRKPRILELNEPLDPAERHLIMSIPVEFKHQFDADILSSLRDIAGVATQAVHPFMPNVEAIAHCFGRTKSILSLEVCDFKHTKPLIYPKRIIRPEESRLVHIDLALSRDSAGISMGYVSEFTEIKRGNQAEIMPTIAFDFVLEVRPPKGGEIEFEKIRELLYLLRDDIGIRIVWVSLDQFQSDDMRQILQRKGFSTGRESMDTTTYPYDILKQAINDKRVLAPVCPKAQRELATLEFNAQKQKVDHPPTSSKDLSDSMAGVVVGLTQRREIWSQHQIPMRNIPPHILNRPSNNKHSLDKQPEALPHEQRLYSR